VSDELLDEVQRLIASPRAGDRLAALDQITRKSGRGTVRTLDDPRVVAL
jgi:hypothetical protein